MYMSPPFHEAAPNFGPQSPLTPAQRYRASLAALDAYCRSAYLGKVFADLPVTEQNKLIGQMEAGTLQLQGCEQQGILPGAVAEHQGRVLRGSGLWRQS